MTGSRSDVEGYPVQLWRSGEATGISEWGSWIDTQVHTGASLCEHTDNRFPPKSRGFEVKEKAKQATKKQFTN